MTRKNMFRWASLMAAVMAFCEGAWAGSATPDSIIVMPARKRVVQIASNLSRCKDIGLVTYNTSPLLAAPLIHVWNGQEWIQISMDEYVQGTFMTGEPRQVFILGDATMLPAAMATAPAWGKKVHKIASLDTATLVNEIGQALKLSPRQWRWLAEVHDLKLQDTNTERRRYGRWGAPGKEQEIAPAAGKKDVLDLPPAPIATDIEPQTLKDPQAEIKVQVSPVPGATESIKIVEPELKQEGGATNPPPAKLPEAVTPEAPKAESAPAAKANEPAPKAPAEK